VAASAFAVVTSACAPRAQMCAAPQACVGAMACVAGRCQPAGVPEIAAPSVRRLVLEPVAIAYLRRGEDASAPALATLGRAGDRATLLLRFALVLPPAARVVEAYVVLARAEAVDADPTPLSLRLTRVTEPWDARALSFARSPRTEDVGSPSSVVRTYGATAVRLDARELVELWRKRSRDPSDHGVAVVAQNETATGVAFACSEPAPKLEVYLR